MVRRVTQGTVTSQARFKYLGFIIHWNLYVSIWFVHVCFFFLGKMFPTIGDVHLAPFTDEQLYMEQFTKANFW